MQNYPSNFHIFLFQSSNFQFCQFNPPNFHFLSIQNSVTNLLLLPLHPPKRCSFACVFFFKRIPIPNFEREREREWASLRERETEFTTPARRVNHLATLPWLNRWWVCFALSYRSSSLLVLGSARGAWRVQEECHVGRIVHEFLNKLGVGIRVFDIDTQRAIWERNNHLREF